MSLKVLKNKIEVKKALAAKYANLANIAGSSVKRSTFMFHSNRFNNQVAVMSETLRQLEAAK